MEKFYDTIINNFFVNSIIKSPVRILPATFLVLCLTGSLLLFLPCSGDLSFIDALFTAVSGVCVTGLSVQDISTKLTLFGQFILMLLIQVGGLGIMSISSVIFLLFRKRMSVAYEKNARSMFDAESQSEIKESLFLVFKYTFLLELIGFIILFLKFYYLEKDVFFSFKQSIFLSVSAFCNAGYALISDNLIPYQSDFIIILTVSALIISGGIAPLIAVSFPKFLKREKLPPMTTLVFYMTIILLIGGTLFFFLAEYDGILAGLSYPDKILNSWFHSVSARTAGFGSLDLSNLNAGSYLTLIFLMIVGGSPGGTAGGIKTTTFGILIITLINSFTGRRNVIRNHEILPETIYKAISLIFVYLGVLIISIMLLLTTQILPEKKLIFEAVSAMGTVGLSMGITAELNSFGKLVIIITMFLGRVMPAMIIYYLNLKSKEYYLNYPKAKLSLT